MTCRALILVLATVSTAGAQERLPRFEPGDCPFTPGPWSVQVRLQCGKVVVARDRTKPEAGTFRLAVAILRAMEPTASPPLVMLHGGPSGPGGLRGGEMARASQWAPRLKRDVVVYDQRGAGLSERGSAPTTSPRSISPRTPRRSTNGRRGGMRRRAPASPLSNRQGSPPARSPL